MSRCEGESPARIRGLSAVLQVSTCRGSRLRGCEGRGLEMLYASYVPRIGMGSGDSRDDLRG